jgi:hypothetical protein
MRRYFAAQQGEKHRQCLSIGDHFQRSRGVKEQAGRAKTTCRGALNPVEV